MLKRTSCYGCPVIFVVPQRSDVRFVSGALRFKWCPSAKKSDLFAKMKICCRCPVLLRAKIHGLLPVSWCPTWSNWHSEHHEVFVAGVLWSKWRPRAITYDLLPLCCASSCTKRRARMYMCVLLPVLLAPAGTSAQMYDLLPVLGFNHCSARALRCTVCSRCFRLRRRFGSAWCTVLCSKCCPSATMSMCDGAGVLGSN